MVFDTSPPPTNNRIHSFEHSHGSSTEQLPLSDERDLSQIEAANKQQQQQPSKWKMISKRRQSCTNDMYATASRYHRLKPFVMNNNNISSSSLETITSTSPILTSFNKILHQNIIHDDDEEKYLTMPSTLTTTRRSTTDCNGLTSTPIQLRPPKQQQRIEPTNQTLLAIVDEESRDSMWPSTDQHHSTSSRSSSLSINEPPLAMFYSDPSMTPCSSSSSVSSFNIHSNSNDLHASSSSSSSHYSSSVSFYADMPTTALSSTSSSSGYDSTTRSSFNTIPDLFLLSPDSIAMPPPPPPPLQTQPDCNLVEQFIDLHLQKQTSFDPDVAYSPPSSFSSSPSSFLSQAPISTLTSPLCCRKCVINNHNQLPSDNEDDFQSISTRLLPMPQQQQQQHQNKRPRSLPIAIQQPKSALNAVVNDDEDDDEDGSMTHSLTCHCALAAAAVASNKTRKKRLRTSEATSANLVFSDTNHVGTTTDKLHIDLKHISTLTTTNFDPIDSVTNEPQMMMKQQQQKNNLEHFIMSPTDKVKVQMKYPMLTNDSDRERRSNELKISQPEDIDFKRSKQKAIRILYQNRFNPNSISSPVAFRPKSLVLPSRTTTAGQCDSPLAKRIVNPRILRSVLSCSVFEADDEHEVASSTSISTRTGGDGTREKSHMEISNCLRINFTESLLSGKILPCGILDGFTVKLGASGLFMPKQVILPVTTFWFNVSEHQASSPYLGFINLQSLPKRGYHTPTKGTITLALLNPNGTAVHLFLIIYDLSDMPPDHRTFIRQRAVLMPETTGESNNEQSTNKGNLRYLAHIRFVTSQTGKLYMHSDIRLIFARNKLDYDDRTAGGKPQLVTLTDMPTPKYWPRK